MSQGANTKLMHRGRNVARRGTKSLLVGLVQDCVGVGSRITASRVPLIKSICRAAPERVENQYHHKTTLPLLAVAWVWPAPGFERMHLISRALIEVANTSSNLTPSPIEPSWIIEGSPVAQSSVLSKSTDGLAWTMVWECSEGKFDWYYDLDETILILGGLDRP